MHTLTVKNHLQKALIEQELLGQISDGQWENAKPHDHWRFWWTRVEIVVGDEIGLSGGIPWGTRNNYNFTRLDLLEVIGQRMINMVKVLKYHETIPPKVAMDIGTYNLEFLEKIAMKEEHWAKKLNEILKWLTREQIREALNSDTYTKKDLKKDLEEIKLAFRTEKRNHQTQLSAVSS